MSIVERERNPGTDEARETVENKLCRVMLAILRIVVFIPQIKGNHGNILNMIRCPF